MRRAKQQLQWTPEGARLLLHLCMQVRDGDWEATSWTGAQTSGPCSQPFSQSSDPRPVVLSRCSRRRFVLLLGERRPHGAVLVWSGDAHGRKSERG